MDNIWVVYFLEKMAFKIRNLALYLELKHYIVRQKSYLRKIHHWERAIGKSYCLVKLALKYGLPIYVRDDVSARHLKGIALENFNGKLKKSKNFKIIKASDYARGYKFKAALIEEGIDEDVIHNIIEPSCQCIVGYRSMNYDWR